MAISETWNLQWKGETFVVVVKMLIIWSYPAFWHQHAFFQVDSIWRKCKCFTIALQGIAWRRCRYTWQSSFLPLHPRSMLLSILISGKWMSLLPWWKADTCSKHEQCSWPTSVSLEPSFQNRCQCELNFFCYSVYRVLTRSTFCSSLQLQNISYPDRILFKGKISI